MDHLFLTIEEFNELLNQWNGQTIKVTKHEMDDIDETMINLENISYSRDTRRIDGYEPMHALLLNGGAEIQNADREFQPLPESVYEIPLEDNALYEFDGSRFLLSTARGVYKIELVDE